MKKPSWVDQLTHATKVTLVICATLLILTAIAALFLMFFPIQKEDTPTVVVEPARHTEYSATTATTAPLETTSTGRHTLSTWNAGVNGYSRSLDEFKGGTQDPRHTTIDPRLWRATTAPQKPAATAAQTAAATTAINDETPRLSTAEPNHEQTVTTVVPEPDPTPVPVPEPAPEPEPDPEPVLTAPPLPVEEAPALPEE